ncbi:MAG: DUF262 domain-containing protein [Paludibacteraceae bacterium]|nr:DUF262 domain-containing protein [Paludibacteraceae bacterium]
MNDNLKKYSFSDLLNEQGKLRIPKIQRDYAQGRRNRKVDEIRKVFVHTLVSVVKGRRLATELDFVYGSKQNNAFEPLDGQQRLTTLFLLYWMMGVPLNLPNDKKHSVFTYETRNTSNEFCDELVQHDAILIIREVQNKNKKTQDKHKKHVEVTPSIIITSRDWFKWEWKYDPTILSMLVMIDAIYQEMDWSLDLEECRKNLNNITFNCLNLGEFGLSSELFVKMNARGKQLSDFDKLKSSLEEELQIQQKEKNEQGTPLATESDESMWRTLMDGAWIDLFWHKYARQKIIDTQNISSDNQKKERLNVAKLAENQFKKLLLRLIAIQLFENENISEDLSEVVYNIDESKIDNILFAYVDSLIDLRSEEHHLIIPSSKPTIDFGQLIHDVNLLIYKADNEIYYETSFLLPEISHIAKDVRSLFDMFLEVKVPNDVELVFYSMLLFLRAYPMNKIKKTEEEQIAWYFECNNHSAWLKNLEDWVRLSRNILLNDNNNQRIDKIQYFREAIHSLKQMVLDLVQFVRDNNLDIELDKTVVKQFLNSSSKTYQRLDNQSLAEERQKACLVISEEGEDWEQAIDDAEQHPYLWGQIRCLLNWADNKLDSFKQYSEKLISLLDLIKDDSLIYYTAMLAFNPNCWQENNRLFQYNKHRDNSFKRYLREHTKGNDAYGTHIKALIDVWCSNYENLSVEKFLEALTLDSQKGSSQWIQCIIQDKSILDEAWNKRIYEQNGHVILAQQQTPYSHCFDPILVYLRNFCKNSKLDVNKYKLYDSKGINEQHAFELKTGGVKYLVKWEGVEGNFSILKDDCKLDKEYTPKEMIEFMETVIKKV